MHVCLVQSVVISVYQCRYFVHGRSNIIRLSEGKMASRALDVPLEDDAPVDSAGTDRSLSEVAYERLLDMLLSGQLVAGSVLQERRLAEALNISRTPIREALSHLEAEGLVTREVGRLMTVRRISVQSYIEILQVRKLL